jgi:hypothetical protein
MSLIRPFPFPGVQVQFSFLYYNLKEDSVMLCRDMYAFNLHSTRTYEHTHPDC